jgi:hypothetical protein
VGEWPFWQVAALAAEHLAHKKALADESQDVERGR